MDAITILNKSNVPIGPFTRQQVAEKLQTGEVSPDDLAFVEGLSQWTPLRDVLAKIDSLGVPPPVPATAPVTPPAFAQQTAPGYSYAVTMQPPGHLVYAGFWLRFVAYFIDGLILMIPVMIIVFVISVPFGIIMAVASPHPTDTTNSNQAFGAVMSVGMVLMELVVWTAVILITWLYFAKLESGPAQATYGKRIMGLKVTNLAGEKIAFGQASGRFFGKIISGMTFYIGFIMAGFTERKQALHDLIAGTLVIRK